MYLATKTTNAKVMSLGEVVNDDTGTWACIPLELLRDSVQSFGNNKLSPSFNFPASEPFLSQHSKRCLLDDAVLLWVISIKVERPPQRCCWVGDNSGMSQAIYRNRVAHQRVKQNHIANLAGHLVKLAAVFDDIGVEGCIHGVSIGHLATRKHVW